MTDFNTPISRYNTWCTQWDYTADRFGEAGLLPFSISDMDLAVPPQIMTALTDRLAHPVLGYSRWRHEDYLSAIVHWYDKQFDCAIQPEWIHYSPSVMYSLSKLIELLSGTGDGICLLTPAYNAFFDVIRENRRQLMPSELKRVGGRYQIDWQDVENQALRARIILLCNPHNPVGRCWTPHEINRLLDIAHKYDCWVISDDIHMDLCWSQKTFPVLKANHPHQQRLVVLSSVSKTFNVPALTGSYALIPDAELAAKFATLTRYRDFVNSPAILNVIATIVAYRECDNWLDDLLTHIQGNIAYVTDFLLRFLPEISVVQPEGCYFAWLDCQRLTVTDEALAHSLVHIGKVGIMSGNAYGRGGAHFLRLNCACPRAKLEEGMHRLYKGVSALTATRQGVHHD
nr:PatB family C-S lyase [uncultured Enterobacter sp.]